jgi:putative pyruvate formate lyase activating enzyme
MTLIEQDIRGIERYLSVVKGETLARHRLLRSMPVDVDLDDNDEELWRAHNRSMTEFRHVLTEGDNPPPCREPNLLDLKIELAIRMMQSCIICEKRCGINRLAGELGECRCGEARVSSAFLHMHEEPELVPSYTIFFSGCNARCCFCQNWDISQNPFEGRPFEAERIGRDIGLMHSRGAKNVNWVGGDPAPHLLAVLKGLRASKSNIANVWNSNMFLSEEAMDILAGTVDLYLTDFKFGPGDCAERYSGLNDYWRVVTRNHLLAKEDAEIIIRHLALPGNIECCSLPIFEWVAENLGKDTRFNLMFQYRPAALAGNFPELTRRLSSEEISKLIDMAQETGLNNLVH